MFHCKQIEGFEILNIWEIEDFILTTKSYLQSEFIKTAVVLNRICF